MYALSVAVFCSGLILVCVLLRLAKTPVFPMREALINTIHAVLAVLLLTYMGIKTDLIPDVSGDNGFLDDSCLSVAVAWGVYSANAKPKR